MLDKFQAINKKVEERNVEMNENARLENQARERKLKLQFERETDDLKTLNEKDRRIANRAQIDAQSSKDKMAIKYDKKLAKANSEREKRLMQFERNAEKDQHQNLIRQMKKKQSNILEKHENDYYDKMTQITNKAAREKHHNDQVSRKQKKYIRKEYDGRLSTAEKLSKARTKKREKHLNDVVNSLTTKNQKALEDLQHEVNLEKTRLFTNVKQQMHDVTEQQRSDSQTKLNSITDKYQEMLNDKKLENDRVKNNFQIRLNNLLQATKKRLGRQKEDFDAAKEQNDKIVQKASARKEERYTKKLHLLKSNFDKKIAKMKIDSDLQMMRTVNDYENQIDDTRRQTEIKQRRMEQKFKDDYERMDSLHKINFEAMKDQYELKLENVKLANQKAKEEKKYRS
ncbi:MAG: hypothetical protein ISR65_08735 [Bacteriovoracaceae bacterium]|nr:hypothetical protein [Bacteriovoracaceae bacterium]